MRCILWDGNVCILTRSGLAQRFVLRVPARAPANADLHMSLTHTNETVVPRHGGQALRSRFGERAEGKGA